MGCPLSDPLRGVDGRTVYSEEKVMIDLAQLLGTPKVMPVNMSDCAGGGGTFSATIFSLDGGEITGQELIKRFPKLQELSDDFPALEIAATAYLVLRHLKHSRVPRLLRSAKYAPMYRLLYGQREGRVERQNW